MKDKNQTEYVLFSPIGDHDPIPNDYDGPALHIFRQYRPKKVYLYLSKTMVERSEKDNRFVKAFERCAEFEGFETEIKLIEKRDLKDVHLFDAFYEDFEKYINGIQEENPGYTVLLNASSGTPAMEATIATLGALSEDNIKAVQVISPFDGENPPTGDPKEFDLDERISNDKDNIPGHKWRCYEIKSPRFQSKIKREVLIEMLKKYNYVAALDLAKEINKSVEGYIPENGMKMLEAAKYRSYLDLENYNKISRNDSFGFLPVKDKDAQIVFEYILTIDIKDKNKNYADFIRAISPAIADVLNLYVKRKYGIDVRQENYSQNKNGKWNPKSKKKGYIAKVENDIRRKEIAVIVKKNKYGKPRPFSSDVMLDILKKVFPDDTEAFENANKLRDSETNLRNQAAHDIVSIDENTIKERCGMTPDEIVENLKFFITGSGYDVSEECWNSYDKMNEIIEENI